MAEIENAKITSVSLTMADHGCLTYWIFLEMNGGGCGYGGYSIGTGYLGAKSDEFKGSSAGLAAMMQIMNVIGVDKWEDLEGKYCRVVTEGWGSTIDTIGNIIKDQWFNQREFFKNYQKEKEKENE